MSAPTFKDHFSTRSAEYASFRPGYPDALVDALADRCRHRDLALDCACGSGQLSAPLARRFAAVIAIDASRDQIDHATPWEGVTYRVAAAERTGLADASADLVAVAQAAHWLDLDRFYPEVRRIAKPGCTLALLTYGILRIDGEKRLDALIQDFYGRELGDYWPPERRLVETGYRDIPFPFREIRFPELAMEAEWDLSQLTGYIGTWSAVRALEKHDGGSRFSRFQARLASRWGEPCRRERIRWPLAARVGQVA